MQYRKHKWSEYQAKLDEDSRTGERLSKAIEHLGTIDKEGKDSPIVIGALYEFKRLAIDSPRDKENVVQILTLFLQRKLGLIGDQHGSSQEIYVAADILQALCRELIEEKGTIIRLVAIYILMLPVLLPLLFLDEINSVKGNSLKKWIQNSLVSVVEPPNCIIVASKILSSLDLENSPFLWDYFYAPRRELNEIHLIGAHLCSANFEHTSLRKAQLRKADLSFASVKGADLSGADLRGANLSGTNLKKANLCGADLRETKLCYYSFGYKKNKARIDEHTRLDPGVRMEYFRVEEPAHPDDQEIQRPGERAL